MSSAPVTQTASQPERTPRCCTQRCASAGRHGAWHTRCRAAAPAAQCSLSMAHASWLCCLGGPSCQAGRRRPVSRPHSLTESAPISTAHLHTRPDCHANPAASRRRTATRTLSGRRKRTLPGSTISIVDRSLGSMAAKYLHGQASSEAASRPQLQGRGTEASRSICSQGMQTKLSVHQGQRRSRHKGAHGHCCREPCAASR